MRLTTKTYITHLPLKNKFKKIVPNFLIPKNKNCLRFLTFKSTKAEKEAGSHNFLNCKKTSLF